MPDRIPKPKKLSTKVKMTPHRPAKVKNPIKTAPPGGRQTPGAKGTHKPKKGN